MAVWQYLMLRRRRGQGIPDSTAFLELLESCMGVGLTTVIAATIDILFESAKTGEIRSKHEQRPEPFFVDCSAGTNTALRRLAEQSMDDFMRCLERFPVVFMVLGPLDYHRQHDNNFRNGLGNILHERDERARWLFYDLDRKAGELAKALGDDYPQIADILRDEMAQPNAALLSTAKVDQGWYPVVIEKDDPRTAPFDQCLQLIGDRISELNPRCSGIIRVRNCD